MARFGPLSYALPVLLAALGCQPNIGDPCRIPSDCSLSGDRICDTNQPGGYCTKFNCEPGGCPEEAACVAFRTSPSSAPLCQSSQETPRFERTFCMRKCGGDADCRSGYACVDVASVPEWSATVVDTTGGSRVCIVPYSDAPLAPPSSEVCAPPADASFPPPLDAAPPLADSSADVVEASTTEAGPPDATPDARDGATEAGAEAGPRDGAVDAARDAPASG